MTLYLIPLVVGPPIIGITMYLLYAKTASQSLWLRAIVPSVIMIAMICGYILLVYPFVKWVNAQTELVTALLTVAHTVYTLFFPILGMIKGIDNARNKSLGPLRKEYLKQ